MESAPVHDGWHAWEPDSYLTSQAYPKAVLWKCWPGRGVLPYNYGLYRYVPRDRVGFLRLLKCIIFASFGIMLLV